MKPLRKFKKMMNCTRVDHESVICDGTIFKIPEEKISTHDKLFWIYLGIYVFLMLFAGIVRNQLKLLYIFYC